MPAPAALRLAAALLPLLPLPCGGCRAQPPPSPPAPPVEFRGAWIATVDNIDWPSRPGLPTPAARQELAAIVDRAAALRLNALVFQVRPSADALYASKLEPWSEWLTGQQGKAPDVAWDPLEFLVDCAHAQGIEVHAWFNPYRARHAAAKSPIDRRHVLRELPDACVHYGDVWWMDPGDPRCADWSLRVIADVVARYDVDGVHIDDYFYPYPQQNLPFPDERSYAAYRQGGGALPRSDWRRGNIDQFVRRCAETAHRLKPSIKFGISPFGIARPGMPAGIRAGIDQYEQLYADVLGWQRDGLCDYLAPQLYWPIEQKPQSFAVLLPWWSAQNPHHRHLWPGLNASAAATGKPPWRDGELGQQIDLIRTQGPDPGHLLFSSKALNEGLLRGAYRELALVPASPWLPGEAPPAPAARLERQPSGIAVAWQPAPGARQCAVQVLRHRRWQTLAVRPAGAGSVPLPADTSAVAVRAVAANGLVGAPAVLTVP